MSLRIQACVFASSSYSTPRIQERKHILRFGIGLKGENWKDIVSRL